MCCVSIENIQLVRVSDIQYDGCGDCCCNCCGTIKIFCKDKSSGEFIKISGIPNGKAIFGHLRNALSSIVTNAKLEIDV